MFRPGGQSWALSKTEDISCEGFYCISESPFTRGEVVECQIVVPDEGANHSPDPDLVLVCRVEVVRVVELEEDQAFGIACRFLEYSVSAMASEGEIPEVWDIADPARSR
jgi:hypothetical protein